MKVKNIVFSGVMAAILGATGANAAAISVASQGYVDSKVKANADAIALKADASTVTALDAAYKLADQGLQNAIDGKVAKADYDVKIKALEDADKATNEYVGTIPEDATARNIVAYVQEKTAGAATSANLEALTNRVATAETDIDDLQGSVNKLDGDASTDGSVKKQIADAIASEVSRSDGAYAAKTIETTVASQGEKITALEGQLGETGATTQAIAAAQNAADAAQAAADTNAEAIEAINNETTGILATAKSYTDTQDAATLASAKSYADGQASAAQTAAEATAASELQSAMQNIAKAYLAKPDACATTYCVLSVTGETVSWMPLTEPQANYYPEEE